MNLLAFPKVLAEEVARGAKEDVGTLRAQVKELQQLRERDRAAAEEAAGAAAAAARAQLETAQATWVAEAQRARDGEAQVRSTSLQCAAWRAPPVPYRRR